MRVMRSVVTLSLLPVLCVGAISAVEARQSASQTAQQKSQQTDQTVTVPLTDPSRPATLTVRLVYGGVTIRGSNRSDISIEARDSDQRRNGRGRIVMDGGRATLLRGGRSGRGGGGTGDSTGLRRLPQSAGFSVEADNNQVQLTSGPNRGGDFVVDVPMRTNLKLSTVNDGPITVENVEGEIEIDNVNDSVTLTNVAGSVVANAHNGFLKVVMTRLASDKAMAFTSFNGHVDVTLPSSTKATLKLRSDMGEIFTDFDVQARPAAPTPQSARGPDGRIRIDVNRSIQGVINGGGPEFEFRTFNGNIYLRKGAQ